jgi:hypothetical protein
MPETIEEARAFFDTVGKIDLDKVRAELSRLRTVNFKSSLEARSPYTRTYASPFTKDADTALKVVAGLVNEWTTSIDRYNRLNRDKAFMEGFLETPNLGAGLRVRGDRAELIYQAGQVLMAYRHDLQKFLQDKELWSDFSKVEPKERSIFCRVIPHSRDEWWTVY